VADVSVYEYRVLHGRADKVEAQLNELATAGWEFVVLSSGSGGAGSALFVIFGAAVTVVMRRVRGQTEPGG
jgi:hypothetical protein